MKEIESLSLSEQVSAEINKRIIVRYIYIISILVSCFGLLGDDPLKFALSIMFVPFLIQLFWNPGEPPVILFGLLFQLSSIAIKVVYGTFTGQSFKDIMPNDSSLNQMDQAFYLSIVGLLIFVFGLKLVLKKIDFAKVKNDLDKCLIIYDAQKVVISYIILYFFASILYRFRFSIIGIDSFLTVFTYLVWGFFIIAFYIINKQNKAKVLFYTFVTFQFIIGFSGYFSAFKDILIFILIGFVFISKKINFKFIIFSISLLLIIFRIGIIWTAVKGEYRNYLSGGAKAQIVTVSKEKALNKVYTLILKVNDKQIIKATNSLIDRIGYIDYFSLTLERVPLVIPFENGRIWKDAVLHIITPRFLFPNKKAIDDSKHTSYYTGRTFTGEGQASFSLGYMADAYIDFGPIFMFIPIFLLGLILGLFNYNLLTKSKNLVWGIIFSVPMYYFVNIYQINTIKVLGYSFSYFLLIILIRKPLSNFIDKFITKDLSI